MRKQELHPRTAVINNKQKNQSKLIRHEALRWLAATFPQVFDNSICIQPLKLGIMADILLHADEAAQAGISKSKLREAVVLFSRRIDYLTCLKAREMRVDLQGNPINLVTAEEAEQAADKIKKQVEKRARSARKNLSSNASSYTRPPAANQADPQDGQEFVPYYPERAPAFSAQSAAVQSSKASAVIIRHKATRQYDPDAIARLKEKLGLSLKNEALKEIVD